MKTRPLSRDAIIRQFQTARSLGFAGGSPPEDATPDATPDKGSDEAVADASVTMLIEQLNDLIGKAVKAQHADPGNEDDPADAKVLAGLEQIQSIAKGIAKDQASDSDDGAEPGDSDDASLPSGDKTLPDGGPPIGGKAAAGQPGASASATTTEPFASPDAGNGGLAPGNSDGIPGDADDSGPAPGDIEDSVICQNPNCGHMASAHNDTSDGDNTGACQMAGCECPGMVPPADALTTQDNVPVGAAEPAATAGGLNNEGGDAEALARFADAPEQLPAPDPMPQANAIGAEFTIPVAWLEGKETSDGRMIDPGALTWRTLPMPLMGLKTSPHDPSRFTPNDPAVWVGVIESITVENGTGTAKGHMLTTDDGQEFTQIIDQMGRAGVSIDVGSAEVEITGGLPIEIMPMSGGDIVLAPEDVDPDDVPPVVEHLVAGEVMGMTVCPFPAFAEAFIILGDGSEIPDTPLPAPTPEQASMGIRFVDAVECEPCAGGLTASNRPLVASGARGAGPLAPPAAWFTDPGFGKPGEDVRLREIIDPKTGRPSGRYACPVTITPEGEYFGHIAAWNICHQSPEFLSRGQCILAPRSRTDYAWFHGRGSVLTAEGQEVPVGRITADAGHAATRGPISTAQALAHYDNSGFTAALVRAGEDEYGIWVHGSVHPAVSEEQLFTLRSCPPSGDWRPVGAGQELVHVLHVNEPGYPVARASMSPQTGKMNALVAAGVPLFELPARPEPTVEERLRAMERGLGPVLRMARDDAKARMARIRAGAR